MKAELVYKFDRPPQVRLTLGGVVRILSMDKAMQLRDALSLAIKHVTGE